MPLRKIPFIKDNFYHVFSRGNRKETIFFDEKDYRRFLNKTQDYKERYRIDIVAFCLLPNHFHLIVKQLSQILVSKFLGTLLNSYARYLSIKYKLPIGHVFQGRFGATLIDSNKSLLQVSRYIHLNPIRKNLLEFDYTYKKSRLLVNRQLVLKTRNYPWSSYQSYLKQKETEHIDVNTGYIFGLEKNHASYRKFVEAKITDEDIINIETY